MDENKRRGSGLTMHLPDISLEERRTRAQAANEAMDAARAAGVEPNAWLRGMFAAGEMVFGVWQDGDAPGGIGVGVLKGYGRIVLYSQGNRGVTVTTTHIRCTCIEEAEAMCRTFGDGRSRAA